MSTAHALRVRVTRVIRETADAHTLVLEPATADLDRFAHRPGQFLTVRVPTERAGGAARCYSLCSSPVVDEPLMITVKRTPGGYGSNWICDNIVEGSELDVLRPAGTFTPHDLDQDFLLVAAGSGITPVMSILKSALNAGTGDVTLVYANRNESSVIFAEQLRDLAAGQPGRLCVLHWLESVQDLPSADALATIFAPFVSRAVYLCGPQAFMSAALAALDAAGAVQDRIHVERFLTLDNDPFAEIDDVADTADAADAASVTVTLDGETRQLAWPRTTHLLDVLLAAGLDAPFSCRAGQCSACACRVLSGSVSLDHNEVLTAEDLSDGYVLACQSVPTTDLVTVTYED